MGTVALRVLEAGALATGFERHPLSASPGSPNYAQHVEQAETLRFLAADGEPTLAPAAIRFALSNPAISTVLVGISDIVHVDAAADAEERGPLSAAELERVSALWTSGFPARGSGAHA
jgi:aryl-alcohol dehydrogenase-like predicted oxidoreductase